jgi:hypothetical protein
MHARVFCNKIIERRNGYERREMFPSKKGEPPCVGVIAGLHQPEQAAAREQAAFHPTARNKTTIRK